MVKEKKVQGKKNRESGARFERKTRADLESKGWVVDRFGNNVRTKDKNRVWLVKRLWKLIPAKSRFGLRTTGFPDYLCFKKHVIILGSLTTYIIGVECKSGKYLSKDEKEKCSWLISNKIFSKILIASKSKVRGKIDYKEFK